MAEIQKRKLLEKAIQFLDKNGIKTDGKLRKIKETQIGDSNIEIGFQVNVKTEETKNLVSLIITSVEDFENLILKKGSDYFKNAPDWYVEDYIKEIKKSIVVKQTEAELSIHRYVNIEGIPTVNFSPGGGDGGDSITNGERNFATYVSNQTKLKK